MEFRWSRCWCALTARCLPKCIRTAVSANSGEKKYISSPRTCRTREITVWQFVWESRERLQCWSDGAVEREKQYLIKNPMRDIALLVVNFCQRGREEEYIFSEHISQPQNNSLSICMGIPWETLLIWWYDWSKKIVFTLKGWSVVYVLPSVPEGIEWCTLPRCVLWIFRHFCHIPSSSS